ncbi:hypothetical protein SMALB_6222 [Streptomyces malaysiensis]|uniref:Uncharacterized protein n=1 Tax=Streptomyces malaysiensis TaxID=92644 RepID=A0A7X5X964_STRMQ|nr:hypothetical protein [Streptomyces malaysiensis]
MPSQASVGGRWPRSRSSSAVQMGVVVTSAVEEATEVMCRLGSQAPKCTASSAPAPADSSAVRRPIPRSSPR